MRDAFTTKLLDTLTLDDVPLMTRVGAVEALHNLAPALPDERVEPVAHALIGLAVSDDRPAHVDRLDADEPLARFKVDMAPAHALRASAIDALGVLASHRPGVLEVLRPAIAPAIASGAEPLIVAALHAIARHSELLPDGPDPHLLLAAPWPSVRVGALGVLVNHRPDAAIEAAMTLLADPDDYVRRQLLHAASHLGAAARPLLEALTRDQDCFVRASARDLLGHINARS